MLPSIRNVGLQLYTLRDHLKTYDDAARTLARVRDMGYEVIQLCIHPVRPRDLGKIANDLGLTVCGMDVPMSRLQDDLDTVLEECRLSNCIVVTGSYSGDRNTAYVDGADKFIDALCRIGERLKGTGCSFAYHNHSFEFVKQGGRRMLETFYEKTRQAGILAEIDTYWVQHGGGDPVEWIDKFANRIPIVHLKDMAIDIVDGKSKQVFAEVGSGNMNWRAILKAAHAANVQWYVVEQDTCKEDPFRSARASFDYLKSIL